MCGAAAPIDSEAAPPPLPIHAFRSGQFSVNQEFCLQRTENLKQFAGTFGMREKCTRDSKNLTLVFISTEI